MICRMTIKLVTNDTLKNTSPWRKGAAWLFLCYGCVITWRGWLLCLLIQFVTSPDNFKCLRVHSKNYLKWSIKAGKSGELAPSQLQSLIILIVQNPNVCISVPGISGDRCHNTHTHTHTHTHTLESTIPLVYLQTISLIT